MQPLDQSDDQHAGTLQNSRVEDPVSRTTSTHLVRILEAGTAASEHVPTGSASTALTLQRTTVPEGHERTTDHFVSES